MRFRLTCSLLAIAAVNLMAAPAVHAFTIEDKDATGQYAVPKFDLEEQSKTFRKAGPGVAGMNGNVYETPFGAGKLQFGVTQGSNFGSAFSPGLGPYNSQAQRQYFDRMLSAPSSLDYDSTR